MGRNAQRYKQWKQVKPQLRIALKGNLAKLKHIYTKFDSRLKEKAHRAIQVATSPSTDTKTDAMFV